MTDDLEMKIRIQELKRSAIVMGALADSFKDESVKLETKGLAWIITWAVRQIEEHATAKTSEELK